MSDFLFSLFTVVLVSWGVIRLLRDKPSPAKTEQPQSEKKTDEDESITSEDTSDDWEDDDWYDDDEDEEYYGTFVIQYRSNGSWVDGPYTNNENIAESMFDRFVDNDPRAASKRCRLVYKVDGKVKQILGTN